MVLRWGRLGLLSFALLLVLAFFSACSSTPSTSDQSLVEHQEPIENQPAIAESAAQIRINSRFQAEDFEIDGLCSSSGESVSLKIQGLDLHLTSPCKDKIWRMTLPSGSLEDGSYLGDVIESPSNLLIQRLEIFVDTIAPQIKITYPAVDAPQPPPSGNRTSLTNEDQQSNASDFEKQANLDCDRYAGYIIIPKSVEISEAYAFDLGSSSNPTTAIEGMLSRTRGKITEKQSMPDQREYLISEKMSDRMARHVYDTGLAQVVSRNCLIQPQATVPNDPLFPLSYHHTIIQTPSAWDYTMGSSEITIAVLDTGIDQTHPEFFREGTSIMVPGFNTGRCLSDTTPETCQDVQDTTPVIRANGVPDTHGTRVAGVIAAVGNNSTGVAGIGWNFKVMPIRITDRADASAYLSDMDTAVLTAAQNGARVINMSFDGVSRASAQTVGAAAKQMGALYVNASGNTGASLGAADHADVIIVGATTQTDTLATFSTFGPGVDVVAPGVSIRTTSPNQAYAAPSGTSFAAPIVSGILGLIWSLNPQLTPAQTEQILFDSADVILNDPDKEGNGRVNAFKALQAAAQTEEYFVDSSEVQAFPLRGTCSENSEISVRRNDTTLGTKMCEDGNWEVIVDLSEMPLREVFVLEVIAQDLFENITLSTRALYRL